MANQSEPLKYQAIIFDTLSKPVWLLKDEGGLWVDLRSVVELLGMSWHRFQLLLNLRRKDWQLESCIDRYQRETFLLAEPAFCRWLREIEPVFKSYPLYVSARAERLYSAWRRKLEGFLIENYPVDLENKPAPGAVRKRKVTAETVLRLHNEIVVIGHSLPKAARNLEIGETTAKGIQAGTYKFWGPDAQEAWWQTFGARLARQPRSAGARIVLNGSGQETIPTQPAEAPEPL